MSNINNTIEYITDEAKNDPVCFCNSCEERFLAKMNIIANRINETPESEIVMLAGPSSAGKTTTAKKLKAAINALGLKSYTVSLDDFYKNRLDTPELPDGSHDFESVNALDVELINKTLSDLVTKDEAMIPVFDFVSGTRKPQMRKLEVDEGGVIIVEGLHALNPVITHNLPKDRLLKIYINVSSRIYDKDENIILNKRNMRFIRRLIRDYKFRGSSPENTFELWKSVCSGEDKFLFKFKDNADIRINTIHLYETCVFRDRALPLLRQIKKDCEYYEEAQKLITSLEKFPAMDTSLVPKDSLLREFLGN